MCGLYMPGLPLIKTASAATQGQMYPYLSEISLRQARPILAYHVGRVALTRYI